MTDTELRLESLRLAYALTEKMDKDIDSPKNWMKDTPNHIKSKFFEDLKTLADMHYDYVTKDSDSKQEKVSVLSVPGFSPTIREYTNEDTN